MSLVAAARERLNRVLPQQGFGRGVAVLAGGTAFGQALTVLAAPFLTRLYGPADFGVLAVYTSMVGIVGGLAALSYHQAIPLPETDREAAPVLLVALAATVCVAGIAGAAVYFGGGPLVRLLDAPALGPFLWMVPLGVLGLAAYETLTQWAVRTRSFTAIARTSVGRGAAQVAAQLGLGLAGAGPVGLLAGQLLGQWVGGGSLARGAAKRNWADLRSATTDGLRQAATRYRCFPQYTAPAVLLNTLGMDAPPLLLAYYFGGTVTGLYALGVRVLMMPVTLVAKSASQVFFASAPQFHREGRLGAEVEKLFGRMLRLALAPTIIIAVAAPSIFAVIFGEEWCEAGVYVRWLSPWLLLMFVAFALAPLVSVLERQRTGLFFQSALAVVRVGSLIVGGLLGKASIAIALFGIASSICWLVYLIWLLTVSEAPLVEAAKLLLSNIITTVPFIVPVAACVAFGMTHPVICCVAAVSGVSSVVLGRFKSTE